MPASPLRYKRLLKELPKHKSAEKALLASGFSPNTAKSQSRSVLRSALKHQAREILKMDDTNTPTSKKLMSEILGITNNDLFDRIKFIALEQHKDYGSALKIISALAKEHGIQLSVEEGDKVSVPILNVIVEKSNPQNTAINIEPAEHNTSPESQE